MDFLKNNIFNQIGNMLKDVTTNLVGQALDVTSGLQKAVISAPGLIGGRVEQKKKELLAEEILRMLEKSRIENEEEGMRFFSANIVHIEIVREDGQLEKAFFPILPFCHSLKMVNI